MFNVLVWLQAIVSFFLLKDSGSPAATREFVEYCLLIGMGCLISSSIRHAYEKKMNALTFHIPGQEPITILDLPAGTTIQVNGTQMETTESCRVKLSQQEAEKAFPALIANPEPEQAKSKQGRPIGRHRELERTMGP